jgi:hypothetical protein
VTSDLKLYLAVLIIATALGIWLFPKLHTSWRITVGILFCTCAVEIVGHISGMSYEVVNLLYQIYTPLSFGLYILIFRFLHVDRDKKKFADISLAIVSIVGIGLPFLNTLSDFPSLSIAICSLVLIVNSLVMFRELIKAPELISISRNPRFILSTAILVYWGLFFFRHGLYNSLINEHNGYTIWLDDIHLWLSVVYYATLAVCIWMSYRLRKDEVETQV